jgi:cAMP-specific phosphodiesterase 4
VLKKEQLTQIRKEFVANILATDIKEHFPMVNNFEAKMKSPKGFEKIPADVELTTTFLIHTSDFAGACMTFNTSRKWAELVNQEFSAQYAEEGELGIAQTPYMKNLEKEEVMAQNEAGFLKVTNLIIQVIVRPLFKLLNDLHDKE